MQWFLEKKGEGEKESKNQKLSLLQQKKSGRVLSRDRMFSSIPYFNVI